MHQKMFEYKGRKYPGYIKEWNAMESIRHIASKLCEGKGLDIGANKWCFPGAIAIDQGGEFDAFNLPQGEFDYIFSSHCLEHIPDAIAALEIWKGHLKKGGTLFLYLPHPDMEYWLPQNNRKHVHSWRPEDMAKILRDLGFSDVFHSERDLYYSFAVVGFNGSTKDDEEGLDSQ